jgi:hypothetical protein
MLDKKQLQSLDKRMRVMPVFGWTGKPRTCVWCGRKLKIVRREQLVGQTRTMKLPDYIPVNGEWVWVSTERNVQAYRDLPEFGFGCSDNMPADKPRPWDGRGDNLFHNQACMMAFARTVANMGFRLPTTTRKKKRDLEQFIRMLLAMQENPWGDP